MDYEKAYHETLEELYLVQENLLRYQTDDRLDLLFKFRDLIDEYKAVVQGAVAKKVKAEQLEKAQNFYHTLITVFNQYGSFYVSEIIARRELFLKEKELFAANEKILELIKQNEKMKSTLNFD